MEKRNLKKEQNQNMILKNNNIKMNIVIKKLLLKYNAKYKNKDY